MDKTFDVSFKHGGKEYTGWATPAVRKDKPPKSFHVVLNGVMFGNVSRTTESWIVDEPRPEELTEAVGKYIEEAYNR